jgi:hypothetical protein
MRRKTSTVIGLAITTILTLSVVAIATPSFAADTFDYVQVINAVYPSTFVFNPSFSVTLQLGATAPNHSGHSAQSNTGGGLGHVLAGQVTQTEQALIRQAQAGQTQAGQVTQTEQGLVGTGSIYHNRH